MGILVLRAAPAADAAGLRECCGRHAAIPTSKPKEQMKASMLK
jgi:hypothetical protein